MVLVVVAGCIREKLPTALTGGCPADEGCSAVPVMVTGGHQFASLSAGKYHTCGRKSNGEVWCWGLNTAGQLGATSVGNSSSVPLKVGGQTSFSTVTAGEFQTCGLATDAGAYCWGNNSTQVLGGVSTDVCGSTTCSRTPVRAAGTLTFSAVDAGATHNCALSASGVARCWGFNVLGELGSTDYGTSTASPVSVGGGNSFTTLSSGFRFNCALDSTGALYCWGYGEDGQLGTLTIDPCLASSGAFHCSAIPVPANTPVRFKALTAGAAFACGLDTAGAAYCWGYNGEGQLGTGDFNSSGAPVAVRTTGIWTSLAAGYYHVCGLRSDGTAFCWGVNNTAQLGDGSRVYASSIPQPVSGGKTFVQIVAGGNHSCGLATDGTVWCWGSDAVKQLGRG
jgi:alpha-tubulin suppressor-like RCC1 family protein